MDKESLTDGLTEEQAKALLKHCAECGIDITNTEFGSIALGTKYDFMMGWHAACEAMDMGH